MKTLNLIPNVLFLMLFTIAMTRYSTYAQPVTENPGQPIIRYGGLQNEHLVFYVLVENATKEKLRFQIRDENNAVLFEEQLVKKRFEQKFLFPKSEMKDIRFEINGKNYSHCRQFAVNTRITEEVLVEETK